MTDIKYVRLAKAEYESPDGTDRNDKLSVKLSGDNRDIRSIELREIAADNWRGWIADINGGGATG